MTFELRRWTRVPRIFSAAAALIVLTGPAPIAAQGYPNRPIRMIVPFGPGRGIRFRRAPLRAEVERADGPASGSRQPDGCRVLVGTEIVQRAAPDGYTLLLGDTGFTINLAYYKNAKYDPLKDFDPITVVADTPYILAVNPNLSYAASLKDFIAAAKAQPGKLSVDHRAREAERTFRVSCSGCARAST